MGGPDRRGIYRRQDVRVGIQQQLERVFCAHLTLSPARHEAARFNHLVIERNITSYSKPLSQLSASRVKYISRMP
ncbi:hypothetical protein D3C85_1219160 [compost metagenome]